MGGGKERERQGGKQQSAPVTSDFLGAASWRNLLSTGIDLLGSQKREETGRKGDKSEGAARPDSHARACSLPCATSL